MVSEKHTAAEPFAHMEGKYEILEKMREGGMGAVYKVRHRLLEEIRVIKMMRPHLARDEVMRARFVREAKTAIRLRHPNLAQLYDFTVDEEGNAFIVMEYIAGPTLIEMARVLEQPELGLALEIAHQALNVIGYLHRRGVIHRDISPDNIILTQDEDTGPQVKLIDLGIAKAAKGEERLTMAGTFIGKVRYSSPEHFKGTEGIEVGVRSDLYSLGIVIYELMTGHYPIKGNNTASIMAGHLIEPPLSFAESDPEGKIPAGMAEVVLKVLAKEPEDRYQDAAEMGQAIEEFRSQFELTPECLAQVFEVPVQPTQKIEVIPDSPTQRKLNHQFAMEETRPPATSEVEPASDQTRPPSRTGRQVRTLLMGAEKLLSSRHYEEATVQLTTALDLDPDNPDAEQLLAEVKQAREHLQEERLAAAEEISVNLERGYLALASEAMAATTDRLGRDDELERLHKEIIAAEKTQQAREENKQHLLAVGQRSVTDNNLAAAVDAFSEALKLDPGDTEVKGQLEQAEQALSTQLGEKRRAQEITSTVAAISTKLDRKEFAEAQRSIEVAEKLYGKEDTFSGLRRRLDEMLVQESQDKADELRRRAAELVEQKQFEQALELLHQALELVPQHMKTMRALAAAKKAKADHEEELRIAAALKRELGGVERLMSAGRITSARRRLEALEQEHGELERGQELRNRIEDEVAERQIRKNEAFAILEQARQAAEKDNYDEAGRLLDTTRPAAHELLEVRDLIKETEHLLHRRSSERRRAREIARVAESVNRRLTEGALDEAERELEVAERLFGQRDAIKELRQQLAECRRQERMARVEELLVVAMTGQDSFSDIIAKLEEALELDPENEKVQRLLAETRAALHRYQQEQRHRTIADAMAEVDELIMADDLQAALDRTEQAVSKLGEFKEARIVRFNLQSLV